MEKYGIDKVFENNEGHEAIIINKPKNIKKRTVEFIETGYVVEVDTSNLSIGAFKDYGRPTVYGVGYSYSGSTKNIKVFKLWARMLERCYSPQQKDYHLYKGKGVVVSDDWLHLKNFERDIKDIEGYDLFIKSNKPFEYQLDKDADGEGLLYSKEKCRFTDPIGQSLTQKRVNRIESTSKDGIIKVHNSINQMCRDLGFQNANVYKVLNGERKHTLGYTFKRLQELT